MSTAAHDSSAATNSFAASNRTLPTGRIRTKRRFPHDASLAIASPPKIATMMMSRNALISASAAAGITRPENCDARKNSPPPPPPSRASGGLSLSAIVMMIGITTTTPNET